MRVSKQTQKYLYDQWKKENKPNYRIDYREKDPEIRSINRLFTAIGVLIILKYIVIPIIGLIITT